MHLPTLTEINSTREIVDEFRGLNRMPRPADNEFAEMNNLTSDFYPLLSPRNARGIREDFKNLSNFQGAFEYNNELYHVDNGKIYKGNTVIDGFTLSKDKGIKKFVKMGAYVIILPDKKYINMSDHFYKGDIENVTTNRDFESGYAPFEITPCDKNGDAITTNIIDGESTDTSNAKDGDYAYDLLNAQLVRWSEKSGMWIGESSTYVKISSPNVNLAEGFSKGDGVNIIGFEGFISNIFSTSLKEAETNAIRSLSGAHIIKNTDRSGGIVIDGCIPQAIRVGFNDGPYSYSSMQIIFERKMPDMDYIISSGNRLWGCKFSPDGDPAVNEIYASKLGDFKQWNCFEGLSTDSYVASLGVDGEFTGAVEYGGQPMFFKRNSVTKVYGLYPAQFQVQTSSTQGVTSPNSIAIVDNILFYVSKGGVWAYNGTTPTDISQVLGGFNETDCKAASYRHKYYLATKEGMYVYDTLKGLWHKESLTDCGEEIVEMQTFADDVALITNNTVEWLKTTTNTAKGVKWMAETGIISLYTPDQKYMSRLNIRMSLAIGSQARISAQYDSMGGWENICTLKGVRVQSMTVPIKPKRCDHFKLRIEGVGDAKIYSIVKTIEQGSDIV